MREPWATLFAGYEDHWLLGQYLRGGEPDWYCLAIRDDLDGLSSGEAILVDFAAAYRNALLYLDEAHLARLHAALRQVDA